MPRTTGAATHNPTERDRKEVYNMAGVGLNREQICKIKGISLGTLKKYYQKEVTLGRTSGVAQLFQKAHTEAIGGNTTMLIFLLKTRGGLVERRAIPVDADGNPIGNVNVNIGGAVLRVPEMMPTADWNRAAAEHQGTILGIPKSDQRSKA